MKTAFIFALMLVAATLQADQPASASYSLRTTSFDAGGQRTASASYSSAGSLGGIGGVSTVASPAETLKSGYIGQLYEVTAVQVSASPTTVDEGTTRLLAATATLDDGTTLDSLAGAMSWSVVSGPISGISASGVATAGFVYQDTVATVQGSFFGSSGTLGLTVLNVGNDDMGIYSGDGIDDGWQVQYFGPGSPRGAASFVSDGSGLSNLFKYNAGLVPNDSTSRFLLSNAPVPGQPGQMQIVISPRLDGRTYTVQASPTLGAGAVWAELTSSTTSDNGTVRTVIDLDATGMSKFYRVQITRP